MEIASAVKYECQTTKFEMYSTSKYLTSLAYLLIASAAQLAPASRLRAEFACGKIAGGWGPGSSEREALEARAPAQEVIDHLRGWQAGRPAGYGPDHCAALAHACLQVSQQHLPSHQDM